MVLFRQYLPILEKRDSEGVPTQYLLQDSTNKERGCIIAFNEEEAYVSEKNIKVTGMETLDGWNTLSSEIKDIHYTLLKMITLQDGVELINDFKYKYNEIIP